MTPPPCKGRAAAVGAVALAAHLAPSTVVVVPEAAAVAVPLAASA